MRSKNLSVDDVAALGFADRHPLEHVDGAVVQQWPGSGATTEFAFIGDPQIQQSGLLTLGGPGLQRGPTEIRGEGGAFGGDHVRGGSHRQPDLGEGALAVDSGGHRIGQLTPVLEEPIQRGDPQMREGLGDHPLIDPRVGVLPARPDQPGRARSLVPALPDRGGQPPQRRRLEYPDAHYGECVEHGVDAGQPGPHIRPGYLGVDQRQDPGKEGDQQTTRQCAVQRPTDLGPAGVGIGPDGLLRRPASFLVSSQPGGPGIGAQVTVGGPSPAFGDPPAMSAQDKPAQPGHIPGRLTQPVPRDRPELTDLWCVGHPTYQHRHPSAELCRA
ncbi:MAG: hypothetical protein ACRDQU_04050 [Pseudonocardiaceae bacterium]